MGKIFKLTYAYITDLFIKYRQIYYKMAGNQQIKNLINRQRSAEGSGYINRLIEVPASEDIELYKKSSSLEKNEGIFGLEEDLDINLDGIMQLTQLMVFSNRIAKIEKRNREKNNIKDATEYEKKALTIKNMAMRLLITNIFVYNNVLLEEDEISFGIRKDKNNLDTFVIDCPTLGQFCVHFGNSKKDIMEEAEKQISSILKTLEKEKRISNDERIELEQKEILPKYGDEEKNDSRKLFEYCSAIPLVGYRKDINEKQKTVFYEGDLLKECMQKYKNIFYGDIDEDSIRDILKCGELNVRELYYLAIKLGCNKSALCKIVDVGQELTPKQDESEKKHKNQKIEPKPEESLRDIGNQCIEATTIEERNVAKQIESKITSKDLEKFDIEDNNN